MEEGEVNKEGLLIYLGILTEVTQIRNFKVPITDKIKTKTLRRMIFIEDISSVSESCILNRAKSDFNDCCEIVFNSGETIRVTNDIESLENLLLIYWKNKTDELNKQDNKG